MTAREARKASISMHIEERLPRRAGYGKHMIYKEDQAAEMRRILIDLLIFLLGIGLVGGAVTLFVMWAKS